MFFIEQNQLLAFIEDFVASLFALNNTARIEKEVDEREKAFYLLKKDGKTTRIRSISKPPFLYLEDNHERYPLNTKIEHLLDYLTTKNLERLERDREYTSNVMNRYRNDFFDDKMVYEYFNSDDPIVLGHKQKEDITFTDPRLFNDPFDCDFAPVNEVFLAQTIAYCAYQRGLGQFYPIRDALLADQAQSILREWAQKQIPILLVEKNHSNQLLRNCLGALLQSLDDFVPYYPSSENFDRFSMDLEGKITNAIDKISGFRILCTSTGFDKILMWSYYANKHQGSCIGRKNGNVVAAMKKEPSFAGHICVYGNVTYSLNRPRYGFRFGAYSYKYASDIFLLNYLIQYAFTKYKDWSHEEEYRFAVLDCQNLSDRVQVQGKNEELYYGCNNAKQSSLPIPSLKLPKTLQKDPNKYKLN